MKLLRLAAILLVAAVPSGCFGLCLGDCFAPTPVNVPAGTAFTVTYETGSIPPPFNYVQSLDGSFVGPEELELRYEVKYRFRDQLPPGQLSPGYSDDDNLVWNVQHHPGDTSAWATLVRATVLGPISPLAPGADSFTVTITMASGGPQTGVPTNREDWEAAIRQLDKKARALTGNPRSEP